MLSSLGYAVSRRFHGVLRPLGLEPGEFALLRAVAAGDGEPQNALAERLHISPSWMVAIVDELEQRGLLERKPHAHDRRVRNLHLTTAGRKLLRRSGRRRSSTGRLQTDWAKRRSGNCSTCSTASPPPSSSSPGPTPPCENAASGG